MKAVLLCAGKGTRLGELVSSTPKPLLPLAGEPLLAYSLGWLGGLGIREILVNIHTMAHQFPKLIGDGSRWGIRLTWWHEPELRGTAGTIAGLPPSWRDDDLLVVYGDLLCDMDLRPLIDLHRESDADATLVIHRRTRSNSLLVPDSSGRIVAFLERPSEEERTRCDSDWVNSGIQILSPRLMRSLPTKFPSDLPRDVYVPRLQDLKLMSLPLSGLRIAIDSPNRYAEAESTALASSFRSMLNLPKEGQ